MNPYIFTVVAALGALLNIAYGAAVLFLLWKILQELRRVRS